MAGWHATYDPELEIGEGQNARAFFRVSWLIEPSRLADLEPTERLVELLDGVMGHVHDQLDFELYDWLWGEERVTVCIGACTIGEKTKALNELGGNGARRVNLVHKRTGKVLRRNQSAQAVDGAAAEQAMTELIREAVVQRLRHPGRPASSGLRIHLGEAVDGVWIDRTALNNAKSADEAAYSTTHRLALDQLPHMRHLTPEEYAAHWRDIAQRIEVEERAALVPRLEPDGREDERREHRPYFGNVERAARAMRRYRSRVKAIRKATTAWRAFTRRRRSAPLRYPPGTHCPGALCRDLARTLARCGDPPAGPG